MDQADAYSTVQAKAVQVKIAFLEMCWLLVSPNCVFDASLVPETWRDSFLDFKGVMSQVPGEPYPLFSFYSAIPRSIREEHAAENPKE